MLVKSCGQRIRVFALFFSLMFVLTGCKGRLKKITSFIEKKRTEEVEEQMELEAFEKIRIDVLNADIVIRHGGTYEFNTKRQKSYKVDCRIDKKTLVIKDAKIGQKGKARVEVMIPMSASLKSMNVSTAVGNINIKKIKSKNVELYSGVGNIKLKKCDMNQISANCDVGNVSFASMVGIKDTALNLSVEDGNVYLKSNSRGASLARKKGRRFIASHIETGDIHID